MENPSSIQPVRSLCRYTRLSDTRSSAFCRLQGYRRRGRAKVKGYIPYFENDELFRWVNIGEAVSEYEADSISLAGFCYDDYGVMMKMLFVAFEDSNNDGKITVKEFDIVVGPGGV